MKKVLIVTYHFPPRPSMGSVRLQGLAKYLPEFGWQPVVLTPEFPGQQEQGVEVVHTEYHDIVRRWKNRAGLNPDEMLRQQIETTFPDNRRGLNSRIARYITKVGTDIVTYPDKHRGWYKFACAAGNRLMQQGNICALISSGPPQICHLIAKNIKTNWGIPWIADLRDPWTQDFSMHYNESTVLRRVLERRLELRTLSKADVLVAVSGALVQALEELHTQKTVYKILNGFDFESSQSISPTRLTDEFTITFTGSLLGCLRDPSDLFKAVNELISEGFMDPSRVQIRFYGQPETCLERLIEQYGMQRITKSYGVISRETALEKQRESQLLLLLNWANWSAHITCTPPGKLFEYFAAQRPILSMNKAGGGIEELLSTTNTGIHASTVDDIKSFLKHCYSEYESKGELIYSGWKSEVDRHSQREMTSKFSDILKCLV